MTVRLAQVNTGPLGNNLRVNKKVKTKPKELKQLQFTHTSPPSERPNILHIPLPAPWTHPRTHPILGMSLPFPHGVASRLSRCNHLGMPCSPGPEEDHEQLSRCNHLGWLRHLLFLTECEHSQLVAVPTTPVDDSLPLSPPCNHDVYNDWLDKQICISWYKRKVSGLVKRWQAE